MTLDLQPRLAGSGLTLRPLTAGDHEALWAVARDPLLWALHPDKSRSDPTGFARFFDAALASQAAFVAVENASGQIVGSTRYYDVDLRSREIAIGYTFLARRLWGGAANLEMKQLLLGHAFTAVETAWFHVAAMNLRSRRAMEKIGARLSHCAPRPQNGVMFEFCYYRIDRGTWKLG